MYNMLARGCDPDGGGAHSLPPCPGVYTDPLCDPAPPAFAGGATPSQTGLPPCRSARWEANVCDVELHAAIDFSYGEQLLSAVAYLGRHNMTPDAHYANFRILDESGFLTLAMAFFDMRQMGLFQRHLTEDGVWLFEEHRILLLRAAEIGERYSAEMLSRIAALSEEERTADIVEYREVASANLAHWRSLREAVQALPIEVTANTTNDRRRIMPRAFLTRWTRRLEQIYAGDLSIGFLDAATRERSNLCDPNAPSGLIGMGLCAIDFDTGNRRPGVCDEPDQERIALMLAARPTFPARASHGMIVRFRWRPAEDMVGLPGLLYCQLRPGSTPWVIQSCSGMSERLRELVP